MSGLIAVIEHNDNMNDSTSKAWAETDVIERWWVKRLREWKTKAVELTESKTFHESAHGDPTLQHEIDTKR